MTRNTPSTLLSACAHAALMNAARARAAVLQREAADRFWRGVARRAGQVLHRARPAARPVRLLEA
ncbi:MAG: hypothetical protein KF686_19380 [Ramlibacter sp.]|nr:hypothetical protein [Ramlibacter sp.]